MDKLQHIDDLLKSSAASYANGLQVEDNDWLAVEKKLRHRKNRIYAVWFFLAFILVSTSIVLLNNNITDKDTSIVKSESLYQEQSKTDRFESTTPSKDIELVQSNEPSLNEKNLLSINQSSDTENKKQIADNLAETAAIQRADKILPQIDQFITFERAGRLDNVKPPFETSIGAFQLGDKIVIDEYLKSKDQQENNNKKGYWEVGASFTPSISGKFVSENSQLAGLINHNYYNNVANNESAAFSNSSGVNVQYHLPSGFFISSGLFISERAEFLNYDYTITESPRVNNNEIVSYTPLPPAAFIDVNYSGSNSYHFVELPINLGYKRSISSNFELRGQIGMSYLNLFDLDGVKANYTNLELSSLNNTALNQNNLAANSKIGLYLNKTKFAIGVEPIFSYNFTSLSNNNSAVNIKPYSFGLNISTNYKLKN